MEMETDSGSSSKDTERDKNASVAEDELQFEPAGSSTGSLEPTAFYQEERGLTFVPPVYAQRYLKVVEVLLDPRWKSQIHKVVDMGCAELGFFLHLKHMPGIKEIVAVDIDEDLLSIQSCRITPLNSDYLRSRENELQVKIFAGSVVDFDDHLVGSDAIVCIELIEHLYPPELDSLPYNIFGQINPKIAVFTTPNSDFNVLFSGSGFRHHDHKFEWSREQFKDWANNLVIRYPHYAVEFVGIGPGPENTVETLGHCSQMAIFWQPSIPVATPSEPLAPKHPYKLVRQSIFPKNEDERPPKLKALHEAEFELYQMSSYNEYDIEDAMDGIHIPLSDLFKRVSSFFSSEAELRDALEEAGWPFSIQRDGSTSVIYLNVDNREEDDEVSLALSHNSQTAPADPWTGQDSDWEMGDATPRPWQSEPQLQASSCSPKPEDHQPPEAVMFRSVNEKQIFGLRGFSTSPEDPVRVDDSGYPNSASVQDMDVTLGSSDDLSNSPEDDQDEEDDFDDQLDEYEDDDRVPRRPPSPPPFPPVLPVPANNHDAVNNNRDGEGNDLGAPAVPEWHQPRPRPRPPPFPRWLLLLLAEERDEGFEGDSSSSDEEDRHAGKD